jgi:ribonucleoside-diphosphate reductase alpha chain
LPSTASVDDVKDVFMQGWKLGLKAIALYRDGCKTIQPLNMKKDGETAEDANGAVVADPLIERSNGYTRRKLPGDRPAFTHKFNVGGHKGYLNVGFYPDTMKPGETFITIAKEGSTFSGLLDTIATLISVALQSGVPLKVLVKKFKDMRFDPSGFTENPDIPTAKSIVDYIFRYLGMKYLSREDKEELFGSEVAEAMPDFAERVLEVKNQTDSLLAGLVADAPNVSTEEIVGTLSAPTEKEHEHHHPAGMVNRSSTDAPVCQCGTLMVRAGSCYSCPNCFATTGVCN